MPSSIRVRIAVLFDATARRVNLAAAARNFLIDSGSFTSPSLAMKTFAGGFPPLLRTIFNLICLAIFDLFAGTLRSYRFLVRGASVQVSLPNRLV